jgi:hypothetical protein
MVSLNRHSSESIECISWAFAGHLLQSIDPICSKWVAPSQALVSPAAPCQSRCMRCLPLQDAEVDWLEEKFSSIGTAPPPTPDVSAETWLRLKVVSLRALDAPMGSACIASRHRCQPRPAEPSSSPAALSLMHRHRHTAAAPAAQLCWYAVGDAAVMIPPDSRGRV